MNRETRAQRSPPGFGRGKAASMNKVYVGVLAGVAHIAPEQQGPR
jgi:hypothetical protein